MQRGAIAEEGKPLHAGQIYRRVMKAMPELEEPYLQLAGLALGRPESGGSGADTAAGARACADATRCRMMVADITLQRGDCAAAIECLAPLIPGKNPQVHYRLAVAFLRLGRMAEAEASARLAVALDGRLADAQEVLGEVLLATRRPGEATVVDQARAAYRSVECAAAPASRTGVDEGEERAGSARCISDGSRTGSG